MSWKAKRINAINRKIQRYQNGSHYIEEYDDVLRSTAKNKKEYKKEKEDKWILTNGKV